MSTEDGQWGRNRELGWEATVATRPRPSPPALVLVPPPAATRVPAVGAGATMGKATAARRQSPTSDSPPPASRAAVPGSPRQRAPPAPQGFTSPSRALQNPQRGGDR